MFGEMVNGWKLVGLVLGLLVILGISVCLCVLVIEVGGGCVWLWLFGVWVGYVLVDILFK